MRESSRKRSRRWEDVNRLRPESDDDIVVELGMCTGVAFIAFLSTGTGMGKPLPLISDVSIQARTSIKIYAPQPRLTTFDMLVPVVGSVWHHFIQFQPPLAEIAIYPVGFNSSNARVGQQFSSARFRVELTAVVQDSRGR